MFMLHLYIVTLGILQTCAGISIGSTYTHAVIWDPLSVIYEEYIICGGKKSNFQFIVENTK